MDSRHLDKKVKLIWSIPSLIAVLIIWVIFSIAILFLTQENSILGFEKPLFILLFLLALLILIELPIYLFHHLEYISFTYVLADTEFVIRHGILTRHTTVVPYLRIQNINTERSIIDRLFGLANLHIETAGTNPSTSEVYLPGVSNKEELIHELMVKVEDAKKAERAGTATSKNSRQLLSEILKELNKTNNTLALLIKNDKFISSPKTSLWPERRPAHKVFQSTGAEEEKNNKK